MRLPVSNSCRSVRLPLLNWTSAAVGGALLAVGFAYAELSYPFAVIGTIGVALFAFLAAKTKGSRRRLSLVYLAWACLALALAESVVWLRFKEPLSVALEGGFKGEALLYNAELGCEPRKGASVLARKRVGKEKIYKVLYQIDGNGLRATSPRSKSDDCVLFFGGSMAFGEGLLDEQTLPYLVGRMTGTTTYNFGFPGFGPHQALRSVETGRVQAIVEGTPQLAVYLTFANHILRMAGKVPWDPVGPKYALDEDGGIRHVGSLSASPLLASLRIWLHKAQQKSTVYKALLEEEAEIRDADIELFVSGQKRMQALLREDFPDIDYKVLVFDFEESIYEDNAVVAAMLSALEREGIDAISTRSVFRSYQAEPMAYHIHRYDFHPSARANWELAEFVSQFVESETSDVVALRRNSGSRR